MPRELDRIAEALVAGHEVEPVSVREFLKWFDAQRRGWRVKSQIREKMAERNVQTVPDFEAVWIDAPISFALKGTGVVEEGPQDPAAEAERQSIATEIDPTFATISTEMLINWVSRDATYRISKLTAANSGVVMISPDARLTRAITLMMNKNYSQLPVMSGRSTVKGMITWKSIGSRLALGKSLTQKSIHARVA